MYFSKYEICTMSLGDTKNVNSFETISRFSDLDSLYIIFCLEVIICNITDPQMYSKNYQNIVVCMCVRVTKSMTLY